jgi:hypothetical protein
MKEGSKPMKATFSKSIALVAIVALSACATSLKRHPTPAIEKCSGKQSPNKSLCAKIVPVGMPPFSEDEVNIYDAQEHLLASKNFKSPDGEHGRNVAKSSWTPNSRFFVFSTASSGGHSPWHWPTYFYDHTKNTFKELDATTGPIIKEKFQVKAPDEVDVYAQGTPSDPSDIETGTLKRVHLSTVP